MLAAIMPAHHAYATDAAYIHDAGYGDHARAAGAWLVGELRRNHIRAGRVIELGCGSGISAGILAAARFDVLGYDLSPDMIHLARRRVPQADFCTRSYLEVRLDPCVAVTAFGECFNYLFDKRNTQQALWRLFQQVYGALSPGGLFVFDVAVPGRLPGGLSIHNREGKDWAVLVEAREDRKKRSLVRRIVFFRKLGNLYRRSYEEHRLRLLPQADIVRQLQAIGFRVRILRGYGKLRFAPGLIGFLARKPRTVISH
jgi:SAM-dependent methyltransferase